MPPPLNRLDAAKLIKSLGAKLANEAKRRGVALDLVRKQYIFAIILSRLFQDRAAPWVLLGGNALLIRTGGGRFTQDVDLARREPWESLDDALEELLRFSRKPYRGDPFEFEMPSIDAHRDADPFGYGTSTARVKVRALISGQTFENHLADKICALYELYGQRGTSASTRYRDLADIVRIVAAVPFDAARLATVLDREARRRRMILPNRLEAPSPEWAARFPAAAAEFAEYPRTYRDLTAALEFAGSCLNDVLSASRASGRWNPMLRTWQPH